MINQIQMIELSPTEFQKRFTLLSEFNDPFAREYFIVTDESNQKRAIYKHYLAQTNEQLNAIYDNIQNYIKLSQKEDICKIIAFTRLVDDQQILATFDYDQYSLAQYLTTPEFASNKLYFYVKFLTEISQIIRSMSEIGIDMDELNYGNILISNQNQEIKIKIFYDQREKTYDKIMEGMKTFTSLQKLNALITGDEEYFTELMEQSDPISPENIYQLGLLMIDFMYSAELKPIKDQGDFIRDRPVHRTSLIDPQKGYFLLEEESIVTFDEEYLNQKVKYLESNSSYIVKQLVKLAQSMMAPLNIRISIQTLFGEVEKINKLYRDYSKKVVLFDSNGKKKKPERQDTKSEKPSNFKQETQDCHSQYNFHLKSNSDSDTLTNSKQKTKSQQKILKQSISNKKNLENGQENTLKQFDDYPYEQNGGQSMNIPFMSHTNQRKKQEDQYSSQEQIFVNQSQSSFKKQIQSNQFPSQPGSSSQIFHNQDRGTSKIEKRKVVNHNNTITKETIESKTNLIQQRYENRISHQNILSETQALKSHNSKKQDFLEEKPVKMIIPKERILMNLQAHQSIKQSLENLIHEIETLPSIKKRQYYDKSVYYGQINPETKKRLGLGVYLYQTGDIYFGIWQQNQLKNGTYIFKNNQSYQGAVKNGKQGWGRYRYSNGNVYEGEWRDDIKEGKGIMWYPNKDKYEGQWVKGKKNGWGKYYYNNGTLYQGNFHNGRKQGFGTITFINGTKIQANWNQTHVEGKGKAFYPNGDYFHGQYLMSQKHGKGLYIWGSDNTKYQGQFRKDCLQGEAKIYFTPNEYYFGRIKNGKRDGQGKYAYQNGDSFNGQWKNDIKLIGQYKFKSGDEFEGKFKENQLNFGVLRYANGQMYEGEFKSGSRHGVGSYRNREGQVVCQGHWQSDKFLSA